MARQEIEGDLWDQSVGPYLLPTSVCVGFRTLSPTSMQNLGSRDPHLTKLALDQASRACCGPMYQKGCVTEDMIKLSLGWVTWAVNKMIQ